MKTQAKRHPEWEDLNKRLQNYKEQQAGRAKKKGVEDKLKAAKTLTQARKVLRGESV